MSFGWQCLFTASPTCTVSSSLQSDSIGDLELHCNGDYKFGEMICIRLAIVVQCTMYTGRAQQESPGACMMHAKGAGTGTASQTEPQSDTNIMVPCARGNITSFRFVSFLLPDHDAAWQSCARLP